MTTVGYKGQQYEVSVFDETLGGRRVLGWTNDIEVARRMAYDAEHSPVWSFAWVTDLFTDISHTKNANWVGDRPLPATDAAREEGK